MRAANRGACRASSAGRSGGLVGRHSRRGTTGALRRAVDIGSVAHDEDIYETLLVVDAVDHAVVAPAGRAAAAPGLSQLLAHPVRTRERKRAGDQFHDGACETGRTMPRSRAARRETTSRQPGGSLRATYSPRRGAGWRARSSVGETARPAARSSNPSRTPARSNSVGGRSSGSHSPAMKRTSSRRATRRSAAPALEAIDKLVKPLVGRHAADGRGAGLSPSILALARAERPRAMTWAMRTIAQGAPRRVGRPALAL